MYILPRLHTEDLSRKVRVITVVRILLRSASDASTVEQKKHIVDRGPLFCLEYTPSATTLFRYSALTFNGHHIHLDKDYAHSEGYPGTCRT